MLHSSNTPRPDATSVSVYHRGDIDHLYRLRLIAFIRDKRRYVPACGREGD